MPLPFAARGAHRPPHRLSDVHIGGAGIHENHRIQSGHIHPLGQHPHIGNDFASARTPPRPPQPIQLPRPPPGGSFAVHMRHPNLQKPPGGGGFGGQLFGERPPHIGGFLRAGHLVEVEQSGTRRLPQLRVHRPHNMSLLPPGGIRGGQSVPGARQLQRLVVSQSGRLLPVLQTARLIAGGDVPPVERSAIPDDRVRPLPHRHHMHLIVGQQPLPHRLGEQHRVEHRTVMFDGVHSVGLPVVMPPRRRPSLRLRKKTGGGGHEQPLAAANVAVRHRRLEPAAALHPGGAMRLIEHRQSELRPRRPFHQTRGGLVGGEHGPDVTGRNFLPQPFPNLLLGGGYLREQLRQTSPPAPLPHIGVGAYRQKLHGNRLVPRPLPHSLRHQRQGRHQKQNGVAGSGDLLRRPQRGQRLAGAARQNQLPPIVLLPFLSDPPQRVRLMGPGGSGGGGRIHYRTFQELAPVLRPRIHLVGVQNFAAPPSPQLFHPDAGQVGGGNHYRGGENVLRSRR